MIVVTGASGNVGRPLVAALAAAGEEVAAVSRRPLPDAPDGVEHRPADLADPASLKPALTGADAVFLLIPGELLRASREPAAGAVVDAVVAAGVRRIVLLSSILVPTRPASPAHARLREFEDAVRAAGTDWTILRPGGFHSNALAWSEPIRARRTAAAPFADVALPFVDPADIAGVAAVVLREPGHAGRVYDLTGPAAVSPRERARIIGAALGAPVTFVEQSRAEAAAEMARFLPETAVEATLGVLGEPTEAELRVSPDVAALLGRPARSFADWTARNLAAFE